MSKDLFVVAELGINHNGQLNVVKELIDVAIAAGCNAVKFQKRTVDVVYSKESLDQPRESPFGTTQRQLKEGLELGKRDYDWIDNYCRVRGIEWFASSWDLESQHFLQHYDLKHNKIASAMASYRPLLQIVADEQKPTFISTAMCADEEIEEVVGIFRLAKCPFTLLHSVAVYPTPYELLNLRRIQNLRERFKCDVGYSGHEIGVTASVMAIALGASVLERHLTLDRKMYGSDQTASLEPEELEHMVRNCRLAQAALGDGNARIVEGEMAVAKKLKWFSASHS